MTRRIAPFAALLLLVGGGLGCRSTHEAAQDRLDIAGLVEALSAKGLTLQAQGPVNQPLLVQSGQEFLAPDGHAVQIFAYRSEASATLDARQIESKHPDVGSPPHFFQHENLIVIYFGNAPAVEAVLNAVLGSRIA